MLRGPKRRAKTDRADAKHLRELLQQGRVPESWIAPEQILELRSLVRLRRALVEQRTAWQQRIHAQLFHHGHPARRDLLARERRAWLEGLELPHAARTQVEVALRLIDQINVQLEPLDRELRALAARWPGTKALQAHYGIGPLAAVAFLAELGDAGRFSSSRKAVRYAGLDITVSQSDSKRAPGRLSRQRPATLRWAAYEAAQAARHPRSPDRDYYLQASDRLGGNRACWRSRANPSNAPTTLCASSARRHSSPHENAGGQRARNAPSSDDDLRPAPRLPLPPRHHPGRPRKTERPHSHSRDHPINHHVAGPKEAADRDKAGRPRAHDRQPAMALRARPTRSQTRPSHQPGRRV